jgi:hypothetical protein
MAIPTTSRTPAVTDVIRWTEAIWAAAGDDARGQKIGSRRVTAAVTGVDGDYLTLQVNAVDKVSVKPGAAYDQLLPGDDILRKRASLGHSQLMRAAPPPPKRVPLLARITPQHVMIALFIVALFTVPPVVQQLTGANDLSSLEKRAEAGDVEAQDSLAFTYLSTPGMKRKYQKAAKWYGEAADKGYAPSEYHLGGLLVEGHPGVPRDITGAAKLYRASAEQGDREAQVALAQLYFEGKGVEKNSEEAYFWAALAAKNGDESTSAFRDRLASALSVQQLANVDRRAGTWKRSQTPVMPESRDPVKPEAP